jgi:hypothetical protein
MFIMLVCSSNSLLSGAALRLLSGAALRLLSGAALRTLHNKAESLFFYHFVKGGQKC